LLHREITKQKDEPGTLLPSAFCLLPSTVALLLLIRNHVGEKPTLAWRKSMNILGWLLFGLIVGAIAKFLMPGRDPGGWIVTILLGIAGSFVGGFLASALLGRQEQTAGWIGSIIGAIVLLFIYRLIVGRRTVV
jgi:uncharacterized membrane protein YeaQ/YmgE (transglycosylase-associated protein family)